MKLAGLAGCLVALGAPQAGAEQLVGKNIGRIGALANDNIGIDQKDDKRVDVDIAVMDSGIGLGLADLNVVHGVDCAAAQSKSECVENTPGQRAVAGDDDHGHGTNVASIAAAIDNDIGIVGVAPGARLWSVRTLAQNTFEPPPNRVREVYPTIAAIEWITDHADQIDVVAMTWGCPRQIPLPEGATPCTVPSKEKPGEREPASSADFERFDEALSESLAAGVIYVVAAAGAHALTPQDYTGDLRPIVVSGMADFDGKSGGEVETPTCAGVEDPEAEVADDTWVFGSSFSSSVDVAAPSFCIPGYSAINGYIFPGSTITAASWTYPHGVGAAALLASTLDRGEYPTPAAYVEEVRAEIFGDGDCAINPPDEDEKVGAGSCEWTDASGDGVHEPMLDLADEEVFNPEVVPGAYSPPTDSDVNGDGRADLVTLRADGVAYVHPGGTNAKFGSGVASFSASPLDPAQYDGVGHYGIDVADVNGDRRGDLVTVTDDGDAHVHLGNADATFADGTTSDLDLPGLWEHGGVEPIAVADVDGDGRADLVVHDDQADGIVVYRGRFDATFEDGVEARTGVSSALHTGLGGYGFVDVADVTGDGRADLVSTEDGDLAVFAGQSSTTLGQSLLSFAAPVTSLEGSVEPAMTDGSGDEPTGLDDSTGDGRADLMLLDEKGVIQLYPGTGTGAFGTAVKGPESVVSSTFGAKGGSEIVGLLDVDGNAHADIVALAAGYAAAIKGQGNGTFSGTAVSFDGKFKTTQHEQTASTNHEPIAEQPSWRRRGCDPQGCGWVIRSSPNIEDANNNRLTDVSCTSATHCFATANLIFAGSSYAYGMLWDGTSWKAKGAIPDNGGTELTGVSCSSASDCVAVGSKTKEGGEVFTFSVHWNGSKWTHRETPNGFGSNNNRLTDVSCTSANFCLATGNLLSEWGWTYTYTARWDGKEWLFEGVPNNERLDLSGVSCSSETDCTAVGANDEGEDILTLVVHWDGTQWIRSYSPNVNGVDNLLVGVSCIAACKAVGNSTNGIDTANLVEHATQR